MDGLEPMNRASQDRSRHRAILRLNRAIELAAELKTVLLEEQAALAGRDLDTLGALLGRKTDAVEALEAADRERRNVMEQADFAADDSVAALSKRFGSLARECSVLNAGNGQAIHARRTQVDQRLAVLRGGTTEAPPIYGRHGVSPGAPGQQTLAEA